jgi:hypothetical protein
MENLANTQYQEQASMENLASIEYQHQLVWKIWKVPNIRTRQVWSKVDTRPTLVPTSPLSSNIYLNVCKCADGFSVSFLGKANDDFMKKLGC